MPSEKAAPGVPKVLVGLAGVVLVESYPLAPRTGRIALGVSENTPALHPPVLTSALLGLPATDSDFMLAVSVSMTRKSSTVIC